MYGTTLSRNHPIAVHYCHLYNTQHIHKLCRLLFTQLFSHTTIQLIKTERNSYNSKMYLSTWEEFSKAAERLYLSNPMKCRFVTKYRHCDGKLNIKATDDKVVLQYRTEDAYVVKKLEKLTSHLIRHMASKER